MANASGATVVFLQSHPAWAAAQRHARQRSEAMRRHPSFLARQRAAARGVDTGPVIRNFRVCTGSKTHRPKGCPVSTLTEALRRFWG
nr:hypothetical protein [Mycobacterium haemophilum]